MPRSSQMPTMTAEVLRLKQENTALRRGLNEAITEIEKTNEDLAQAERDLMILKSDSRLTVGKGWGDVV